MSLELAWVAGFFEGEGSVTTSGCGWKRYLRLQTTQHHSPMTLERCIAATGIGRVSGPYRQGKMYSWQVDGQAAHNLIKMLRPYLTENSVKWKRYKELLAEGVVDDKLSATSKS